MTPARALSVAAGVYLYVCASLLSDPMDTSDRYTYVGRYLPYPAPALSKEVFRVRRTER